MHLIAPSKNRSDLRSVTPKGFARAVFAVELQGLLSKTLQLIRTFRNKRGIFSHRCENFSVKTLGLWVHLKPFLWMLSSPVSYETILFGSLTGFAKSQLDNNVANGQ
jgi:hypothetical protein